MKIPVVRLWPVISIVLCSCALKAPSPPPVVLAPAHCPAPAVPLLPQLDPAAPLEGDANLEALLRRDAVMRRYISGWRPSSSTCSSPGSSGACTRNS